MPELRTEITEIVTGLGMTGLRSLEEALAARPPVMRNVTDDHWVRLDHALASCTYSSVFAGAWRNGRAFFQSSEGLRERVPAVIEWKGSHQPPGFDFMPVDLRVDHVYLVSCKYQSRILSNSSPWNLFERRLSDRSGGAGADSWYAVCAPEEYQEFYSSVRHHVGPSLLPATPQDLTQDSIRLIRQACRKTWPPALVPAWAKFSAAVAEASVERWLAQLPSAARREEMLWRLLRLGPTSYFILGSSDSGPLRLRIGTPWDWRQGFTLKELLIAPTPAGQPRISWVARVIEKDTGSEREVRGHVEVRWGHGRFSSVEAKIYLDTPHAEVPGYFLLPAA